MVLILKFIETHPALVTIVLCFLGGIGFLIKHFLFSEKKVSSPYIKAGGDISAGGDIVVGNKTTNQSQVEKDKNIETFTALIDNASWRKELIDHKEIWVCDKDNTFQIEQGECGGDFQENWVEIYPDRNGQRYPVYLKINNTTIKELTFISCDGGRIFVPMPERHLENEHIVFSWRLDSLPLKVCKIIGHYYIHKNIEGVAQMSKIRLI